MGWNEDFAEGRRSPGSWSNQPGAEASNAGARQGQREYDESMRRAYATPASASPAAQLNYPTYPNLSGTGSPQTTHGYAKGADQYNGASGGASTSMVGMAKAGAVLCALLFGAFVLTQSTQWSWSQIAIGAAASSAMGAVAGVALFIAIRVILFLLKVTLAVAGIGVVLHVLGVIDFGQALGHLARIAHTIQG